MADLQEAGKLAIGIAVAYEGFSATPYPDPGTGGEPWTIGYGSTRDVNDIPVTAETPQISVSEAMDLAMRDMFAAFSSIAEDVCVPLTTHQMAAIMDFVYNVGAGNFCSSTLCRLLNLGEFDDAAQEFEKWDHADGKIMAGLLRRRLAEKQVYLTPDS